MKRRSLNNLILKGHEKLGLNQVVVVSELPKSKSGHGQQQSQDAATIKHKGYQSGEKFADKFVKDNPGIYSSATACYTLCYLLMMLQTSLHNPKISPEDRMDY